MCQTTPIFIQQKSQADHVIRSYRSKFLGGKEGGEIPGESYILLTTLTLSKSPLTSHPPCKDKSSVSKGVIEDEDLFSQNSKPFIYLHTCV